MSIFDDIPLPAGTEYYGRTILEWNPETGKYLVEMWPQGTPHMEQKWLPKRVVENHHAASLEEGLNLTKVNRASPQNTRFFRRKERDLDDQ